MRTLLNCLGPLLQAGATLDETLDDTWLSRLGPDVQNMPAWRYMERLQAAGGGCFGIAGVQASFREQLAAIGSLPEDASLLGALVAPAANGRGFVV